MNFIDKIIFKLSKKIYIKRFIKKNYTNMRYKRYGFTDCYFEDIYCYYNIKLTYDSFNIENGTYNHFFSDLDKNLNYKKNHQPVIKERLDEYYNELYPLFNRIILNGKLENKLQTKNKIKVNKI